MASAATAAMAIGAYLASRMRFLLSCPSICLFRARRSASGFAGRFERRARRGQAEFLGSALVGALDVLLEEVVQERPDDGDGAEHPDVLPRGRDDAVDDVRRELELEPEQQPHAEPAPDDLPLAMRGARGDD